jgi:hypothetical protein
MTGSRSLASSRLIFQSAGWRFCLRIHLYMAFMHARAKYALGYGSLALSYVRAALVRARNPSASRSGSNTDFCQPGRAFRKNFASI